MTHDEMVEALTATGAYRVLRRLAPRQVWHEPDGTELRLGVVLDVETTGLDQKRDEIIELSMVPFTFSGDGRIFEVRAPHHWLRQPSIPIPPEITRITGIDADMVEGHAIDPTEVAALIEPVALVIAHNAAFDRPFAERLCDAFKHKCWSCSMTEIDWSAEGRESTKLAWLMSEMGLFYDRHRSVADCHATVELLGSPLPTSGALGLAKLLDAARAPTYRIWASGSPFEAKDVLKERGYRWCPGENQWPKSWYVDVNPGKCDAEIAFLRAEIYHRDVKLRIDKLTAFDRFSEGASPS